MIHTVGDSHGWFTFLNIPGVSPHTLGPLTLRRVGLLEDDVVPQYVQALSLQRGDLLILCFGEPDIRCHLHRHVTDRGVAPEALLRLWVDRYLTSVAQFQTNGARVGIMSVTPPCRSAQVPGFVYPIAGTDAERAAYTRMINELLRTGSAARGWYYIDVYSECVDATGMISLEWSNDGVHFTNNARVRALLNRMGFLA